MKENNGIKLNKLNGDDKESNHSLNQKYIEDEDIINKRKQKEINMEEFEEKLSLNEENEEYFPENISEGIHKQHIYNYQGKYIEKSNDFIQENNDIQIYDSYQDLSFEKNFSQENPSSAKTNENEKDLSEMLKENKGINYLNTRQKNEIKNTSTIGEVSNENVSSLSYKDEESSNMIHNIPDDGLVDNIYRSSKNLDRLDFIVLANKSIQNLSLIDYSHNRIKLMDDSLFYLGKIITIDLSYNHITKIQNLDNCLNLKHFNISHNQVHILEGLYHLQHLEDLDISYNKILMDDILVKKIKFNKSLKSVNLAGNPKYNFEELKYKILENMDNLCILDNIEIFKHKNKLKAKATSHFKLFFQSGNQNFFSDKPHNLKSVKEYIKFKKYFYQEEKKLKKNLN